MRRMRMTDLPSKPIIQEIDKALQTAWVFERRCIALDVCGAFRFDQRINKSRELAVVHAVIPGKPRENEIKRIFNEAIRFFEVAKREVQLDAGLRGMPCCDFLVGPADIVPCHAGPALRKRHTVLGGSPSQIEDSFILETSNALLQLID